MARLIALLVALDLMVVGFSALAQPKPAPSQTPAPSQSPVPLDRSLPVYQYYSDAGGNKVLLQTNFTLSNFDSDTRSLRRLHGIVAGLNERGFKKNPDTSIRDWDKRESFTKCYVYLDELQAGKKGDTGARVWCAESGISEFVVTPSENPKHVQQVLERFDLFLTKAKQNLKK